MCCLSVKVKVGYVLDDYDEQAETEVNQALVGTVEELSQSTRALSLIRDQFETNFFSAVNVIKSVLPSMREKKNGHIVVMTGISKQ
jgi:NAD(P)-dependent dehydrogenase (short-subunit alcohol dehydrogenase family)